ncbi:hypothetical protein LINPERHAP1_LOCUS31581, partial [Linum perenne]
PLGLSLSLNVNRTFGPTLSNNPILFRPSPAIILTLTIVFFPSPSLSTLLFSSTHQKQAQVAGVEAVMAKFVRHSSVAFVFQ